MFKTLKSKFILSFILLEVVFFIIIVGINFNSLNKASQTLTNEKINTTSKLLVEMVKTPLIVFDLATIDDIVKNFSTIENAIGIQVEDKEHTELSSYLKTDTIPQKLFNEAILRDKTDLTYKNKEYIFNSVDVVIEDNKIGHIHFVFDATYSFKNIENNKNLTYLMVIIALLISLAFANMIGSSLSASLRSLTKLSDDIAHDRQIAIPKKLENNDEISSLFKSMYFMKNIISERTQKLNKSIKLFGDNVIASSSDLSGKITYASQALCDISGYTEEELLGQPHNILRHTDMPSKIFNELWHTITLGRVWYGEIKNSKKDGGYYWVSASVAPEFDDENNIIGYTSIRHDITAQKVKEEFMANMSHELRTPLNAIIGFSDILSNKLKTDENLSLLKHIRSSSASLLSLINDILDLSKIHDSKFAIEPYAFNAYDEILNSYKHIEGLTSQKNIILKNKINKNLNLMLFGDWYRISQIILNIISNSIKFTEEYGEIDYKASYQNNNLVITVCDNGIGMSKQVQDKIFKPFEQADGSTTRKYGGTGLGLSITQSLVELMHGKIELESQEGVGTSFSVSIPLSIAKVDQNTVQNAVLNVDDNEKTLSGHILVVEDNKTNQLLIKILLEDFGLTCDIANDGIEAVEIYDPDLYKVILMDENMPRMNGLEAMKILQEKHKDKCGPIIALTANAMANDKDRFLKMGMDGYIPKPIDNDVLYNVLKEFL